MATTGGSGRIVAGRYRLERLIGRGGAGAVWRGLDERLHRPVAVKEIPFPTDEPRANVGQVRALREARAAARLSDAGVVRVYDVLEDGDGAYLIMELVDAPNLSVLVRRAGPLRPHAVAAMGLGVLDTLVAAHRAGIVHRDVKPSNVLVDDDTPRLTDFGIALLGDDPMITSSGLVMGTPAYIAPEHVRGEVVGPPADLYGLGATLYYAVEGTPPFSEGNSLATVMAVLDRPPRRPRRAGPLAALLDELLVKDPAGRPTADEVRDRLVAIRDGAPRDVGTAPPSRVATTPAGATSPTRPAEAATSATARLASSGTGTDDETDDTTDTLEKEPSDDAGRRDEETDRRTPVAPPARLGRRRPAALVAATLLAVAAVAALGLRPGDSGAVGRDDRAQGQAGAGAVASPSTGAGVPDDGAGAPAGSPSAVPSQPGPDVDGVLPAHDVDVPAEWVVFSPDDAPYRVAHPPDWQVVYVGDTRADIRDPRTGTYLRLDWVAERRDPVAAWEAFEPIFADRQDDYRRVALEPTTYRGNPAALWEYRYRSGAADLHAYNLGVNAGDYGFALNLQARQRHFGAARRMWPYFLASYDFTPP